LTEPTLLYWFERNRDMLPHSENWKTYGETSDYGGRNAVCCLISTIETPAVATIYIRTYVTSKHYKYLQRILQMACISSGWPIQYGMSFACRWHYYWLR
jgi:hypothetical protein